MRILTFNWHEAYIHLLAKTGHRFEIVERLKGGSKNWLSQIRPVPQNAAIVDERAALERLDQGGYDLVICHNLKDLMEVQTYSTPKIMVFHNKLSTEIALSGNRVKKAEYLESVRNLISNTDNLHLIFISEGKRTDWGLPGEVIHPGIDSKEYYVYEGEEPKVLRVGNFIKERDVMMGFTAQEEILRGIPSTLLGINPTVSNARLSESWEDLKEHYRSHRVYLNTTVDGWEDGYNLAMLEAMATGMPVVSAVNSTSPIVDGHNGYISDDLKYLREKILYLLENRDVAIELGKNARRTVEERFNIGDFIKRWGEVMEGCIVNRNTVLKSRSVRDEGTRRVGDKEKGREGEKSLYSLVSRSPDLPLSPSVLSSHENKNIILAYVSYPATTARYLESSLRKSHNVITIGPSIWPELIRKWKLENMREEIKPHNIPCGFDAHLSDVLRQLPQGFQPDLLLWVESIHGYFPQGIRDIPFPTACYLIDSHISLDYHLKWARNFDFVFAAQREYIPKFQEVGLKDVHWLPLACDPKIHRKFDVEKIYDISFIGSITPDHPERRKLLGILGQHFDVHVDRQFLEEMARVFSQSKIVFNKSVKNDLNMRVFEALSCGSMLLTDAAKSSGLEELFKDREHLVIYRDEEELVDLAEYYLAHPGEREEIAGKGREEVLRKHTYDHRAEEMMKVISCRGGPCVRPGRGDDRWITPHGVRRKSEDEQQAQPFSKPHQYYEKERWEIIQLVPKDAARILDVGCAAGYLGGRLKEQGRKEVVGVEIDPEVAREAERHLDQVIVGDIEEMSLPFPERSFDCIICADVLEHLRNPGKVLRELRRYLADDGAVVASIPNVRYLGVINHLVAGNWSYQKEGILDESHLRFFTRREMVRLFDSSGYEIQDMAANISLEYDRFKSSQDGSLNFGRITIRDLNEEEFRDLFVFQYLIKAGKKENGLLSLADSQMKQKRFDLAVETLNRAKESCGDGGLFEIYRSLGDCYAKLDRFDEAEEDYERAIHINPHSEKPYVGLGMLSLQRGDFEKAKENFSKAVKLNPRSDDAICGLGLILWNLGEREEGYKRYAECLDANPENMTALLSLVKASFELDRLEVAEKYLNEYLALHPANPGVLYSLGGIYFKQGKREKAQETLERILIFEPEHKGAREILDRMGL